MVDDRVGFGLAACAALPGPLADAVAAELEVRPARGLDQLTASLSALGGVRTRVELSSAPALVGGRAAVCDGCRWLALCGGDVAGCRWGRCGGVCDRCPVRCLSRSDLAAWVGEAGGRLDLGDLSARFPPVAALPSVLPVMAPSELVGWGVARRWPAWAVSLSDAHSAATGRVWSTWADGSAARRLRKAGVRVLVLSGVASDARLAAAWPSLRSGETAAGFDMCVGPGWSVYDDDPRLEQLFALRQSAMVADRLAGMAVPVVPVLSWYRRHDLDRQLAWLERCGATAAAVDCSTLPGAGDWDATRAALVYVRAAMPGLVLHVNGPATAGRLEDLAALRGGVVVHSGRPAALARAYRYLDGGLVERAGGAGRGECLLASLQAMSARLSG